MGTGLIYIHVTHHLYILGGGFKDFLFKVSCSNSLPAGILVQSEGLSGRFRQVFG